MEKLTWKTRNLEVAKETSTWKDKTGEKPTGAWDKRAGEGIQREFRS